MNKFELDKIMECLGLEKKESYEIKGCKYCHSGSYYTIVKGKTPYELALLISEKYNNNIYKIRVNGNIESEVPSGDVYTYHIDTIEGLVVFLLETHRYYQLPFKETEFNLQSVYNKILQEVDPKMSIYDWMLDRENRKDYFKTLLNMNTVLDFELRKKIEEFDNIVNPFCNNNLDLNSSKFIVRGYLYQDGSWFSLIDEESGITMYTFKENNGFVIKLCVPSNSPYITTVYHYFKESGEEIAFDKYDQSEESRIEYNLTNFSFGEHYGIKHTATAEDKKFVILNLDKYITLASDIVKKNIRICQNEKKLKRN